MFTANRMLFEDHIDVSSGPELYDLILDELELVQGVDGTPMPDSFC